MPSGRSLQFGNNAWEVRERWWTIEELYSAKDVCDLPTERYNLRKASSCFGGTWTPVERILKTVTTSGVGLALAVTLIWTRTKTKYNCVLVSCLRTVLWTQRRRHTFLPGYACSATPIAHFLEHLCTNTWAPPATLPTHQLEVLTISAVVCQMPFFGSHVTLT